MTTQAQWEKIRKAERDALTKAKNVRMVDTKNKDDAKKIKSLNQQIAQIQRERIDPARKEIKNLEIENIPLIRAYNDYLSNAHKPPTSGEAAYLKTLAQPVDVNFNLIKGYTQRINDAVKAIDDLKTELKTLTNPGKPYGQSNPNLKTSSTTGAVETKLQFSKDYKYNAPMVSSAYFGTSSLESTILEGNYVDQGKFPDALQAWTGVSGGKGTIQMDRKFLSTFTTSAKSSFTNIDKQKYGFKFLYNPQTVSMAWGLMSSMDPYYEATQLDKFQVVANQLMSSTVSFQLMLNRIKDFDYIKDGISGLPANTYPEFVSSDDLDQIYKKGTMYDIEYLLKTINGPDATFVSQLNGLTSDRGWLRPTIVELHLGASLRYRVRISEFAVNHVIFNPRMVPILSTVTLTCSRFVDGPSKDKLESLTPSPNR